MATKKIPKDVRAYLSALGRSGGKKSLETMTAEERTERAKKAAAASAKVRSKKAKQKRPKPPVEG